MAVDLSLGGGIEAVNRGVSTIFSNTSNNDLAIYTATSNQRIHLGCGTGGNSAMTITGSNVNVSGTLAVTAMTPLNWILVTNFQNNWTNFGIGNMSAAYSIDEKGIVRLRGLVKNGGNNTIFTLPVGMRPTTEMIFCCISNNGANAYLPSDVRVTPAGSVQMNYGYGFWLSLDGINFSIN